VLSTDVLYLYLYVINTSGRETLKKGVKK